MISKSETRSLRTLLKSCCVNYRVGQLFSQSIFVTNDDHVLVCNEMTV